MTNTNNVMQKASGSVGMVKVGCRMMAAAGVEYLWPADSPDGYFGTGFILIN